jgi:hypothetical protein
LLDDIFWNKVDKTGENSCWNWCGSSNNKGYGMHYVRGRKPHRKWLAHRISYEAHKGTIPDGMLVLHSCDNPRCVNPEHLRVGTHKENVADMDERNRRVPPRLSGELNHNTKLTGPQVIQMRLDYLAGKKKGDIAKENGMTIDSVGDVLLGRSWAHLLGNGGPSLDELKAYAKTSQKSNSVITQEIADKIRERLLSGEMGKDLASEYGISGAAVSDIKHGRSWASC